jgi:ATP synthase F1 gamma subunit
MAHPLLAVREEERCVDLVVVTADRGLCGGFNANLVRKALEFFREHEGVHVRLTLVGRKGYDSLKRRPLDIVEKHEGLPGLDLAAQIAGRLADDFTSGRTDGAYLIYSHFRSTLSQVPTVQRLLPVSGTSDTEEAQGEYLYEPGPGAVLDQLLFQRPARLILARHRPVEGYPDSGEIILCYSFRRKRHHMHRRFDLLALLSPAARQPHDRSDNHQHDETQTRACA